MAGLDIIIVNERAVDAHAIGILEDRAFGPGRYSRTAFRLREGNAHDLTLSFIARVSTLIVGSIRLSHLRIGDKPALLLGPLTVDPAFRSKSIGKMLMETSIAAAKEQGHRLIILVGDEAYYGRVGFKRVAPGRIIMPGPVDPMRLLALELVEGALSEVKGVVRGGG
jgi:predicted N-acetyltransferase YhbS